MEETARLPQASYAKEKDKFGDAAKKMKPWKYEQLMSLLLSDLTARG